jgi:hypothetical protein
MRIPINQIKENQYTSGNELVEKVSYKPYKGYYYVTGNKFFSGKIFNIKAIELIKKSPQTNKVTSFGGDTLSYFYNAPESIQNLMSKPVEVRSISFTPTPEIISKGYTNRYFVKKANTLNIMEVSEDNYSSLTDPIYTKIYLIWKVSTGFNQNEVDSLDKSYMIGIKSFLQNLNYNPEEDLD